MAKQDDRRPTGRAKVRLAGGEKVAGSAQRKRKSGATRSPKRAPATKRAAAVQASAEEHASPADPGAIRKEAPASPGAASPTLVDPAPSATNGWGWTPIGIRRSLAPLTVDADQAQIEQGALKATVSIRRGDEILYHERVNFDWPGGRDKFLRKATRAVAAACLATGNLITEALLAEMREALRMRPGTPPAPVTETAQPATDPVVIRAEGPSRPERKPARAGAAAHRRR